MSGPRRLSLSRQARQRMLLIFLVSSLLIGMIAWLAWRSLSDLRLEENAAGDVASVQFKLDGLYTGWQRESEALAATLMFNRMLESSGETRWLKLRAFIAALGESLEFEGLAVVNDQRQPMFSLGKESGLMEVALGQHQAGPWLASTSHRKLYRVTRAPLWLGPEGGHGEIVMLRALDNRQLAALANHDIRLHLTVGGVLYASSSGNAQLGMQHSVSGNHRSLDDHPCRDLDLGGQGQRLHIEQLMTPMLSPLQFALAGLALVLALSLGFNGVIGTWLRQIVNRLDALSRTVSTFKRSHKIDAEVHQHLERAAGQDDEVSMLRKALNGLMQTSQERDEETRAYMQTLDILEEAVVEIDRDGRLLRASPAWPVLMGPDCDTESLYQCIEPEDRDNLQQQMTVLFAGDKAQLTVRLRVGAPQRSGAWLEGRFVPVDHPVTRVRGVLRDVTQIYLQEKHITHMALHDALTGLPNRVLLEDRLKIATRMALRENSRVGVGFIDLDHFKNVNDALGHKIGDRLLIAFAENARQVLRTGDTLARWGGDEFVVLLPDMPDLEDIRLVAEKLGRVSRDPIQVGENLLPVTFSMGFAVYPDDGDNVDTLLSQADRAMFYAKAQGRNTAVFYADMGKKGLGKKELYIQGRLSSAISGGQIQTWYQPLVDAQTRKVVGLEALARWHDPDLGWISPATFIPMAENLGLISELGESVSTHALTVGRRLRDAGRDLMLSINISKRQLFLPRITERLLADVQNAGLEPNRVVLEITESVAMSEVEYALDRLDALHKAGFQLAVDDFGVGYSSLSQLHEMPVNEVKIDISFTQRALDPQGSRLIQAIVAIAKALDLTTVAEGVEDEATARVLTQMGVDILQGYHFSRPLPDTEIETWLAQYPGGTT